MQLRAEQRMDRLRLFGRRGASGADRPHRFVGDDDAVDARAEQLRHGAKLTPDDGLGRARLALGERLADADDRREAVRERG